MQLISRISIMICLGVLVASIAFGQNFSATLNGAQEVPPNASPATGSATLVLDGALMLNIHTNLFPGGEIRGRILPTPVPVEPRSWGQIKNLFD